MCGIVGIIDPAVNAFETRNVLQQMTDSITHRGPDDEGFFVNDEVGLGMRRLSIIDPEGGQQPISNEDNSVHVVSNGEIYNYRELAHQLRTQGHDIATDSDTEVIVHLYEEYGRDCVQHLRGMFAFAIWDSRKQELFVARDRLGIKPLYYWQSGDRLVFASEIKALLQHPCINAAPNLNGISAYLSVKYVPSPQTMFAGIKSLPPGHGLTVDRNGVQIKQYWDLSFQIERGGSKTEDDYVAELDDLLHQTVKLRLRSDVPFGAFLSGGVDSSVIVALMSRLLDEPVKTFSVGFEHSRGKQDELPYARKVANQFGTDHHEVVMRPDYFTELAQKVTWHLDQPIADQATLATFAVSELASRHVKMVLSGEGGDELFAGYARYLGERYSPLFRFMPRPIKSLALAAGAQLPRMRRQKIALFALCQKDEVARFTNWFPLFNSDMQSELVAGLDSGVNGSDASRAFGSCLAKTDADTPLNRMLYVDTKLWLPDFLLLRGDKMSMANSLEARTPFLDHKLVEFAASLPPKMKLNGMVRKYLLKKVARKLLPTEIVDRKKEGFPIPISSWFRNEMNPFVRDMLSEETIQRRGLFNAKYVTQLIEEHESRLADHGMLIWGLISLELWYQIYIDSPPRNKFCAPTTVFASQHK